MARFKGSNQPPHDKQTATGILITNLGTPDAPTTTAVRKYLAEFLNDPRVIETPRIIWWPILYGIILLVRPKRSAEAYAKVWSSEGSPLRVFAERQLAGIKGSLPGQFDGPLHIELAMRYGNPSIASALEKMRKANVRRLLVFPLYPQYSATTTASTFDAVANELKTWRWLPELRMINHYHDEPGYISALTESIRVYWATQGKPEKLLFSFHGLPKKYFDAGDPYFCECQKTARLVAEQLELEDQQWTVSFQSRFGPMEWLKPYTGEVLENWARAGTANVQIICPGFSADCLETLEEIQLQYRSVFLNAGGKQFAYIPALNDNPDHIETLTNIVLKHLQGWEGQTLNAETLKLTCERAEKLGR
jgi:ferrochelatase